MTGLKVLKLASISLTTAWFLRMERYCAKSTVEGVSDRVATLRRTSSLRFLNACRAAEVEPLRPRVEVMLAHSTLRAALRCGGC